MDKSNTSQNSPKNFKKIGLRKAVGNHCRSCIFDKHEPGTWRMQVEQCIATICDLYLFRPHPIKKSNGVRNEE